MAIGREPGQLVEPNQPMWLLLGRCRSSSCHMDDLFGLLASGNRLGSKQYLIERGDVPLQRLLARGLHTRGSAAYGWPPEADPPDPAPVA